MDAAEGIAAERLVATAAHSPGLSRAVQLARRLLVTSGAQVTLLPPDGPVTVAATGADCEEWVERLCVLAAESRQPLVVSEVFEAAGRPGTFLGVPLVDDGGAVVGALCVFDDIAREWGSEEVSLLQELTNSTLSALNLSALAEEYQGNRLRWNLAVDAAGVGSFDWNLVTDRVEWDDILQRLFGYGPGEFVPEINEAFSRVYAADKPILEGAIAGAVETCGDYQCDYRVQLPSGDIRWLAVRGRVLCDEDGVPARILGSSYDTTDTRTARDQAAQVLATMSTGLFFVDDSWKVTYLNEEGERILRRRNDDLVGRDLWEEYPGASERDFGRFYRQAMQTGQTLAFEEFYPHLSRWYEVRAVPNDQGLGVYFHDVTERKRAEEEVRRGSARLELLNAVSAELTATLEADAAVASLARVVVPALADWVLVSLVEDDGTLRDVGCWHVDEAQRSLVEAYAAVRLTALNERSLLAEVLRTGEPVIVPASAEARIADGLDHGPARELLSWLAPESVMVLPLRGRGATVGVMSLFSGQGKGDLSRSDEQTAREVAARAGLALDNARLYRQQTQMAEGLQRSLMTEPPQPDHLEIAVRYQPAAQAAAVGGDWYDAFLQPDGTTVLVIGDVVGHDVEAAAAMGQLRGVLRGIAFHSGAGPADVLAGLDGAIEGLMIDTTATAVVARLEQDVDELQRGVIRLRWSNAGHPPPMVVSAEGSVLPLVGTSADLLLGLDPTTARVESQVTVDRGGTVLLYTDGLVERRGQSLDEGLDRLREALQELNGMDLDMLCDELLTRLLPQHSEDDVALVAVRLHRQDLPRPDVAGENVLPDHIAEEDAVPVFGA